MEAALITGKEQIEFRTFAEPEPQAGAAVVRVDRCGICGTDVAAYRSGSPYAPFLCGHEWTGTVLQTSSGEKHVRDGDRVVMGVPVACGQCPECRRGVAHRCAQIMALAVIVGMQPSPAIFIDQIARLVATANFLGFEMPFYLGGPQ